MIKKILKAASVIGAAALFLMSCSNLSQDDSEIADDGKTPYLALKSSAGRSAVPSFGMDDFDTITLTGYKSDETDAKTYTLGKWETSTKDSVITTAYSNLESDFIAVPSEGYWTLTLTTVKGKETENAESSTSSLSRFSDTLERFSVTSGKNDISFILEPVAYDTTGKGKVDLKLVLTGATSGSLPYSGTVTLTPYSEDDNSVSAESKSYPLTVTSEANGESYDYTAELSEEVDSGVYLAVFNINKGSLSNVVTRRTVVTVTNGITSTMVENFEVSSSTINAAVKATTYTISFELNGGEWAAGYTKPATYNTNESGALELPVAANVSRLGYVFYGWVDSSNASSGVIVTSIPSGTAGNKTYTAQWTRIENWTWNKDRKVTIKKNGEENTVGSMIISWDPVPGADGYRVFRHNTTSSSYDFATDTTSTLVEEDNDIPHIKTIKYKDTTKNSYGALVRGGEYYFYAVKAYHNTESGEQEFTDYSNIVCYTYDGDWSSVKLNVINDNGVLSWEPVYGASRYCVYKYVASENDGELDVNSFDTGKFGEEHGDFFAGKTNISTTSYTAVPSFSNDVYYAVRAHMSGNGSSRKDSEFSNVIKIEKASAPVVSYSNGSLSWESSRRSERILYLQE